MSSSEREILPLSSLRFIAALLVLIEHVRMIPGLEGFHQPNLQLGVVGVSIFFVLSGFILSYTYWDKNWIGDFGSNSKGFFWSRFCRIYPLHWLMFAFALPLGLHSNTARVNFAEMPLLLTLTDKFWPGTPLYYQPVKAAWTLSCEAFFYSLTPFLLLFLQKTRNPLRSSALLLVLYTLLITVIIVLLPGLQWVAYVRLPDFLLGMVGFHLARTCNFKRFAVPFIGLGCVILGSAGSLMHLVPGTFATYLFAPGSLLLVLGFSEVSGRLKTALSLPLLVVLGHSSYSLYLLHDPVMRYTKVLFNMQGYVLPPFVNGVFAILLMLGLMACSYVCFRFYENPVRLKLRGVFRTKISTEPATTAKSLNDQQSLLINGK